MKLNFWSQQDFIHVIYDKINSNCLVRHFHFYFVLVNTNLKYQKINENFFQFSSIFLVFGDLRRLFATVNESIKMHSLKLCVLFKHYLTLFYGFQIKKYICNKILWYFVLIWRVRVKSGKKFSDNTFLSSVNWVNRLLLKCYTTLLFFW